tara:strand:+ start:7326 stop:8381 length:1056 start_codon:yes stop_codon:yes gene_type:complete
MLDKTTSFFKIKNNFAKTENIVSVPIVQSTLAFDVKVTIAIPTYKRAKLLKESLESAINQIDYEEYDIIIVDNNPERGCETEKLMMLYNNPRISYYKNKDNIGMFGNWNRCIELSKGEYITILNDDDLLHHNYLKNVVNKLFLNQAHGIFVCYSSFRDNNNPVDKDYSSISLSNNTFIDYLYSNNNAGSLGALVKRSDLMELGGFNEIFFPTSDYVLWANYLNKYGWVYKINEELAYYRLSVNESLNENLHPSFVNNDVLLLDQMIQEMKYLYKFIAKMARPVLVYGKYLGMAKFSNEFKSNNIEKINTLKSKVNFKSKVFYFTLGVINRVYKIKLNTHLNFFRKNLKNKK